MIPVSEADLLHDNGFWVVIDPKGKTKWKVSVLRKDEKSEKWKLLSKETKTSLDECYEWASKELEPILKPILIDKGYILNEIQH
jgi:hypothetical protein